MTKKVVTSLLLSTALLPMLSGKADTASTNQKPAAATKGNSAASAASQQVTLSAGSQTETTAAGATDQSVASDGAKTDDQAESTSTTTATTSATSRVTVRAASQAAKAGSTGLQSQSSASEAAKDNAAASATADSTTSAVDQLDKTAKASAATSQASHSTTNETAKASAAASQDSHITTDQSSVTVTSEVAKSAAPKQATEQAVAAKISPKIETAVAADAVQSSAMMARSTRAMTSQEIFLSQIKAGQSLVGTSIKSCHQSRPHRQFWKVVGDNHNLQLRETTYSVSREVIKGNQSTSQPRNGMAHNTLRFKTLFGSTRIGQLVLKIMAPFWLSIRVTAI